jgi:hypothetical protein
MAAAHGAARRIEKMRNISSPELELALKQYTLTGAARFGDQVQGMK